MRVKVPISFLLLTCVLLGSFPTRAAARSNQRTVAANAGSSRAVKNRAPLRANAFDMLPLTSIKPRGWLRRQLQIQADGLTGHLDEFWPDVSTNSGWLGGTGESWERGPYYMDGLIPLAYLLDEPKLMAKAKRWVEWTLTHQRADGLIGPEKSKDLSGKERELDWWPIMVMLKVLTQYQEATNDPRVIPLMTRYFEHHLRQAKSRPLYEWAKYRWGEELVSILWLYNRTGDRRLLELAQTLRDQGFDWGKNYDNFRYVGKTSNNNPELKAEMSSHGVNIGMALKYPALWSLFPGEREKGAAAVSRQFELLDKYHGLPNGMYSADEHLGGTGLSQGTELCAVVEAMFSLEHLIAVEGNAAFGDRLEKISFNALPGTLSADMWSHQYDQQPNQVLCSLRERDWSTNGPEANLFGLEPNFGCCTANLHQGWPKLAASLWMATSDEGLAAVAYAPNTVNTTVKGGVQVSVAEETEYPFKGQIKLTVSPASPVSFPLQLRIPAWAEGASVTVNGKTVEGVRPSTFHKVERTWRKGDRVELVFPMRPRVSRWSNDSIAVERGPLVFSLKIGEDWRRITQGLKKPAPPPAADWEVHPTSPWNYGLMLDVQDPAASIRVIEKSIGGHPFSLEGTPVEIRAKGRRVPEWTMVNGSAGPPPEKPAVNQGRVETITLVPYGAARLRITAFPQVPAAR